jgi:cytolethal distending toxin subunit A
MPIRLPTILVLSLLLTCSTATAESLPGDALIVNEKTHKCLTIAGGTSHDDNIPAVQFACDNDSSRRWQILDQGQGRFEIRNRRTHECLTIAGGVSTDNSVPAVQYECDGDRSRYWYLRDVTGNRVFQLQNAKTGKCLTIKGGTLPDDNLEMVQYDCDQDSSRRWTILLEGRFVPPRYKDGTRLDNCDHFGTQCGQPAADDFCRIQGYQYARAFDVEHASPTKVINYGQKCIGSNCVAFKYIACATRNVRPGKVLPWPQIID